MTERPPSAEPRELEATLRVLGPQPQAIFDAIASRREVAGYALRRGPALTLDDTYFDTPDYQLRQRRAGLRLRRDLESGTLRATLKGRAAHGPAGIKDRPEWECDVGEGNVREATADWVRDHLKKIGLELPTAAETERPEASDLASAAISSLSSLGLGVIQKRTNRRRVFELVEAEPHGGAIAELDLDTVEYRSREVRLTHWEIEIEARSESGREAVPVIARALMNDMPGVLVPWRYGKLALGAAFESLTGREDVRREIDANGRGSEALYAALVQTLRQRRR